MKILTWNVNGLRAVYRKGKWRQILDLNPDIICLQETKTEPQQLPPELQKPEGFKAYFASSSVRRGYSGVATYTKQTPQKTVTGLGVEKFDEQGRVLNHFFDDFVLINAYFPNGASKTASLEYEHAFFEEFIEHALSLRQDNHKVLLAGDVNVAHERIDLARPRANQNNIGFLPEERAWLDEFEQIGLVDVYRHFHPARTGAYTYWDMRTRARERNVGWRLDYFYASADLLSSVREVEILQDIYGSDHCPVELTIG